VKTCEFNFGEDVLGYVCGVYVNTVKRLTMIRIGELIRRSFPRRVERFFVGFMVEHEELELRVCDVGFMGIWRCAVLAGDWRGSSSVLQNTNKYMVKYSLGRPAPGGADNWKKSQQKIHGAAILFARWQAR